MKGQNVKLFFVALSCYLKQIGESNTRKIDDNCVGCTSLGMTCLGGACPNSPREVAFCDTHTDEYADYIIDGEELCEDCAKEYLLDLFKDHLISEQAEMLDVTFEDLRE